MRFGGVDVKDIGAPCHSTFRNAAGKIWADVKLPQDIIYQYGGGFVGLLRPDLYKRMLAAIPEGVVEFNSVVSEGHRRQQRPRSSHIFFSLGKNNLLPSETGYTPLRPRCFSAIVPSFLSLAL